MDSCAPGGAPANSLIGLKFGQKIYFEGVMNSGFQSKAGGGPPQASTPPPAKRGRSGIGQGGRPPVCLVEGCNADLSDAKPYYSKHKVCGIHSKFPKVIVAGIEQRFCQQCSRFHQLSEFDREKRSCRRRLAGHNERRRKPLLSPRYGNLSSSLFAEKNASNGDLAVDFNSYSTPSGKSSWLRTGNETVSPWQSNSQNPTPDLLQAGSTRPAYFNGVSGALSLLSNQPWGSRTPMVQPTTGQLSLPSWAFKSNQANTTLPDMHAEPGSGQLPHLHNGQYIGELGLAQPTDGQFHELEHSRVQHMRWPR